MKRPREGPPPPTPSLFPHEFRARQVVALLLSFRHAAENGNLAMAQVPREIVRMICGWVRADFRGDFVDLMGNTWTLKHRRHYSTIPLGGFKVDVYPFLWCRNGTTGYYACPFCLSFSEATNDIRQAWVCQHGQIFNGVDNLVELKRKYILPL